MNETEKKHSVCAANCPLNKVITVHDIGFADCGYYDPETSRKSRNLDGEVFWVAVR